MSSVSGGSRRRRNALHSAFAPRSSRFGLERQLSAAVEDGDSELVKEILTNAPDTIEWTDSLDLLHSACESGDLPTVAVLLRYGAGVNTYGKKDCAPLHVAVRHNSLGAASLLLSHGANVNLVTKFEKRCPLHIAATFGYYEMIGFLLENRAKVDQVDIYGSSALQVAARVGQIAAVKTLLQYHADPNIFNNDGWTALHLAAESGNTTVVNLLLDSKAFIDCQNKYGRTPLHWACASGHSQVIELLLERKANVSIIDRNGKTALDHAYNPKIRSMLERHQVSLNTSASAWSLTCTNAIGVHVAIDNRAQRELCTSTCANKENINALLRALDREITEVKSIRDSVFEDYPSIGRQRRRNYSERKATSEFETDSGRGSTDTSSAVCGIIHSGLDGESVSDGKLEKHQEDSVNKSQTEFRKTGLSLIALNCPVSKSFREMQKPKSVLKLTTTKDRVETNVNDSALSHVQDCLMSPQISLPKLKKTLQETQTEMEVAFAETQQQRDDKDSSVERSSKSSSSVLILVSHCIVHYLVQFENGWRVLIQQLSLDPLEEQRMFQKVAKMTAIYMDKFSPCTGECCTGAALTACSLFVIQNHMAKAETGCLVKKTLNLLGKCNFGPDAKEKAIGEFLRLIRGNGNSSSPTEQG